MTDRWSTPSGGLGVNRFRVWPTGPDSYKHADLAQNWDTLDAILGIPAASSWPPDTGVNGGIYKQIALLINERTPIGSVVPWFRPSGSISVPTGWAVADGSVLTAGNHNFPGIGGSVTLPDLRNTFILGADPNLSIGAAAAAVSSGSINTAAGAPGAQATGGSNTIVQTTSQMPSHTHTFAGTAMATHTHAFTGTAMPVHKHSTVEFDNSLIAQTDTLQGGGTRKAIVDIGSWTNAGGITAATTLYTNNVSAGTPAGTNTATSAGTPAGTNSSTGSGSPMDNRPRWVGLIYIVKVLYSTTP